MRTLFPVWIDTHCHLDAHEFEADRDAVVARAQAAGVTMLVMPIGLIDEAAQVRGLAQRYGFAYALGLHPLWLEGIGANELERLREAVFAARADPRFVAVGEIGIDLVEARTDVARQEQVYRDQLRIARDAGVPVLVHVRHSADLLLKHLRRVDVPGGIIHAFNGSTQQAQQFIARGFRLGFGGTSTYSGSLRIRRHAAELPESAIVVETDAPYIAPVWRRADGVAGRTEPADLARIAAGIAALRGIDPESLARINRRNALAALPRLAPLVTAA